MGWLLGMFMLLPIELVKLPLNVSLVDVWTLAALPIVWLSVPRGKQTLSMYYTAPMWLILVASFASTWGAPAARNGLIVIAKEIFVYFWFLTVIIALVRLSAGDFHRVLVVWSVVVLMHGLIIVAQFLSPQLWQLTAQYLGRGEGYDIYRPSGLLANANAAAFFQLLGFVPLLLAGVPRRASIVVGLVLLGTMMATGSMGSIVSFIAGAGVAFATLLLKGRITIIVRFSLRLAVVLAFIGALLVVVISQNERMQTHLSSILVGRAGRSSESRFSLWERGLDVIVEERVFLWGVGPENFRVVDGAGKQLHNDFMAFSVERGLIGIIGLSLFALMAMIRALNVFLLSDSRWRQNSDLLVIVLLAAMMGVFVYSITHQIFHNRQLWMVLALQEAMFFRMMAGPETLPASGAAVNARNRFPVASGFAGR